MVAIVARGAYVLVARPDPFVFPDSAEYDAAARDLLAGRGSRNTIGFVRPPLYPLFVAACYSLGGLVALQIVQALVSAAAAPLVGRLSEELHARRGSALFGGLGAALYPWFFPYAVGLASETLFTALTVGAFVVILRAERSGRMRAIVLAGMSLGVAALARTNILVAAPLVGIWWASRRGPIAALVFAGGCVAALLPFAAVQWWQGNGLVVGSSGGGMSFYIGNNPETALLYSDRLSDEEWRQLNLHNGMGPLAVAFLSCPPAPYVANPCEALPMREREAYYYEAGFRYIRSFPATWAETEVRKLLHYWRPWVEPKVYSPPVVVLSGLTFAVLVVLALFGLRSMRPGRGTFVILIALAASGAAIIYTVQLRYRFALLDPVLIAAAAGSAAHIATLGWRRVCAAMPPAITAASRP